MSMQKAEAKYKAICEAAVAEAGVRGVAVTGNSSDVSAVRTLVRKHRPDAIICGNDRVAADMLASLGALGKLRLRRNSCFPAPGSQEASAGCS